LREVREISNDGVRNVFRDAAVRGGGGPGDAVVDETKATEYERNSEREWGRRFGR
jgi:hypothetical protein